MKYLSVVPICCRIRNLFEKATEFQTTPDDRPFTSVPVVVPVVATVMQGLIYLLACSSFFLSSFVDPGIYPRGEVWGWGFTLKLWCGVGIYP